MAIQKEKTSCNPCMDFQIEETADERKKSGLGAAQTELDRERTAVLSRLWEAIKEQDTAAEDILWEALILFQKEPYYTAKGLDFTYSIKGNEMFVTRKDKSITRATVVMSFKKALELEGCVKGPKKLGTFGASYLYPVFQKIGVIKEI